MRGRTLLPILLIVATACSRDSAPETDGATNVENILEKVKVDTRLPLPLPLPPTADPRAVELARTYTAMFYADELDAVYEKFSPEMKERGMTPLQLATLRDYVRENYGNETQLVGEESAVKNEYRAVVRWARFDLTEDVIQLKWYMREDDTIAGFFIGPAKRPDGTGGG